MYNKFLERLLENNPKRVISKRGIIIRKLISPILRHIVPIITPNSKLEVLYRAKMSKVPIIFAATHGFREDVEHTIVTAGRQAYMLNGALSQVLYTFGGIAAYIAGVILIDRTDKESRSASKKRWFMQLKRVQA